MKNYFKQEGLKDYLLRQEVIDPNAQPIITYSAPGSMCGDFPAGKLCNMAGGFPFEALGCTWQSSEHLYLLGYWSDLYEHPEKRAIQEDVLTAKNGYVAKRFKKNKYKRFCRPDFVEWKHEWMMFVVWKKCVGNADFRQLLLSTGDAMIVEVVKNDAVWAAWYNDEGKLVGANAMGKILMLCREALRTGIEPKFKAADFCYENHIDILGRPVLPGHFYAHRTSMCDSADELNAYCREPESDAQYWVVEGPLYEESVTSEPIPILEPMEAYLQDKCWDMSDICDDYWSYELNNAIVNDLQYIAEYLHVEYDWDALRQRMASGGWYADFLCYYKNR